MVKSSIIIVKKLLIPELLRAYNYLSFLHDFLLTLKLIIAFGLVCFLIFVFGSGFFR